jgi:hypothetical protein
MKARGRVVVFRCKIGSAGSGPSDSADGAAPAQLPDSSFDARQPVFASGCHTQNTQVNRLDGIFGTHRL